MANASTASQSGSPMPVRSKLFPTYWSHSLTLSLGLTIATDLSVAILPIPVFNSLHLPKRQKIALMVCHTFDSHMPST